MKILVTCPPMLGMIDSFRPLFAKYGAEITTPSVVQTLSVAELVQLVPNHDGWIIGDDPATREVFVAGKAGLLKAAVKWGIGVDNVDFEACKELEIPIANTPNMFGAEVADIAMGYVVALARETFQIDDGVRQGARGVHPARVHSQFQQLAAELLAGQRVELGAGLGTGGHDRLLPFLGRGDGADENRIGQDVLNHAVDARMDEAEVEGALGGVLGDDLSAPDDLLLLDHGLVLLLDGNTDRSGCGDVLETALDFNRGVQA